ncbi:hypothetical protein LEN26_018663 [Aphanomyces euteiches]|nr:hypothetical protein LEN26_018663 [Aphanomyces euteiches]
MEVLSNHLIKNRHMMVLQMIQTKEEGMERDILHFAMRNVLAFLSFGLATIAAATSLQCRSNSLCSLRSGLACNMSIGTCPPCIYANQSVVLCYEKENLSEHCPTLSNLVLAIDCDSETPSVNLTKPTASPQTAPETTAPTTAPPTTVLPSTTSPPQSTTSTPLLNDLPLVSSAPPTSLVPLLGATTPTATSAVPAPAPLQTTTDALQAESATKPPLNMTTIYMIAGGVVLGLGIIIGCCCLCKRRRRQQQPYLPEVHTSKESIKAIMASHKLQYPQKQLHPPPSHAMQLMDSQRSLSGLALDKEEDIFSTMFSRFRTTNDMVNDSEDRFSALSMISSTDSVDQSPTRERGIDV